jgi:hypothetical protein
VKYGTAAGINCTSKHDFTELFKPLNVSFTTIIKYCVVAENENCHGDGIQCIVTLLIIIIM